MRVFRIENKKYLNTFPPLGSKFGGGRWHTKGMWLIYTSENISLAKLETLANCGSKIPKNRSLVEIEINDEAPLVEITTEDIPANWHSFPYPPRLAEMIDDIISSKEYVGAIVPSVQSSVEKNILLFPDHPEFAGYVRKIHHTKETFDPRLK